MMHMLGELKALNDDFVRADARVDLLSSEILEQERHLLVCKRLLQQNERDLQASKWTLRDRHLVPLEIEVLEQRQELSQSKRQLQQKKRECKEAKGQLAAVFKKQAALRSRIASDGSVLVRSAQDVDFLAVQKERYGLYCELLTVDDAVLARAKEKNLRCRKLC